jgi:hypothetical protein
VTAGQYCVGNGTGVNCNATITSTTDTNTNVTSVQVTGTTTKTLNLEQPGIANLTTSWTDNLGGNSTSEIQAVYFPTLQSYTNLSSVFTWLSTYTNLSQMYSTLATYLNASDQRFNETTFITNVNTSANIKKLGFNLTSELDNKYYSSSNPSGFISSYTETDPQVGLVTASNLCESNGTGVNCNITWSRKFGNSSAEIQAAELDAAHDTCAEISGCVVGAITSYIDSNTNVTSIQVTGTSTKTLNLEQPGIANLTTSWTDIDTDTIWQINTTAFSNESGNLGWNFTTLDSNFIRQNEYANLDLDSTDDMTIADNTSLWTKISNVNRSANIKGLGFNLTSELDNRFVSIGTKLGNSTEEIEAVNYPTLETYANESWVEAQNYVVKSNLRTLLYDDFTYWATARTEGIGICAALNAGTAATTTITNMYGSIRFSDSTTINGGYQCRTDAAMMYFEGNETFSVKFMPNTNIADYIIEAGFSDASTAADPTDGCWFKSTNLVVTGYCKNNAGPTATGSTYTLTSGTTYTGILRMNEDATSANFTIFDEAGTTSLWSDTVAANIPTTTARAFGTRIAAWQSTTSAAAILVWWDWVKVEVPQ